MSEHEAEQTEASPSQATDAPSSRTEPPSKSRSLAVEKPFADEILPFG